MKKRYFRRVLVTLTAGMTALVGVVGAVPQASADPVQPQAAVVIDPEALGHVAFAADANVLGIDWLIEPVIVPFYEGDTIITLVDRLAPDPDPGVPDGYSFPIGDCCSIPQIVLDLFADEYLCDTSPLSLLTSSVTSTDGVYQITATVRSHGREQVIAGEGNGPVSAFVDALAQIGYKVRVLDYAEHAMSSGGDAQAAAYVETEVEVGAETSLWWGVGVDGSIVTASLKAVCSAVNRAWRPHS